MATSKLIHSYILLKDKKESPCGQLLMMKSEGEYTIHSHGKDLGDYKENQGSLSASPDEVAPLTWEECSILDGFSPANRYTLYSSGKLAWGAGLKVGDTVLAKIPWQSGRYLGYAAAVIRWHGVVEGDDYFCLELRLQ